MQKALDMYAEQVKIQTLAAKIIRQSQMELMACMPYLDRALLSMNVEYYVDEPGQKEMPIGFGTDGHSIHAVPAVVLDMYMSGRNRMNRTLFHTLLHCLFTHMYAYDKMDAEIWDLSADMAVENVILELNMPSLNVEGDDVRRQVLSGILTNIHSRNAESIYSWLNEHPASLKDAEKYAFLFHRDRHDLWRSGREETYVESAQKDQWDKTRKQVSQEAEAYEKARGLEPGTLTKVFHPDIRKHEDCRKMLAEFIQMEEEVKLDLDSFDYVYYTYGLNLYKNMPLIEPLEYKVDKKIHDFVIAVDTSGSCAGEKVKNFIQMTYALIKDSGSFDEKMNVHIIQCDARIQEEVTITSENAFDEYMQNFKIKGLGGTDFRPVFDLIEKEKQEGQFHDLRGLIYFTDGHGTYPSYVPSFKTAVVMPEEDWEEAAVPPWAVRMIMNEETK